MNNIRTNPPASVETVEQLDMYRTVHDDITKNGTILKYHDRHLLGELAVTLVEMNDLRRVLRDEGEHVEVQGDRNKVMKKNPARDALEKLRPAALRIMKEFQMSPSSRPLKINTPNEGNTSDGFGLI